LLLEVNGLIKVNGLKIMPFVDVLLTMLGSNDAWIAAFAPLLLGRTRGLEAFVACDGSEEAVEGLVILSMKEALGFARGLLLLLFASKSVWRAKIMNEWWWWWSVRRASRAEEAFILFVFSFL
jgi:hypothetical protein